MSRRDDQSGPSVRPTDRTVSKRQSRAEAQKNAKLRTAVANLRKPFEVVRSAVESFDGDPLATRPPAPSIVQRSIDSLGNRYRAAVAARNDAIAARKQDHDDQIASLIRSLGLEETDLSPAVELAESGAPPAEILEALRSAAESKPLSKDHDG